MRRSVSIAGLVLVVTSAVAYANPELLRLQTDDKQWVMPGKDYSATRFSTLNQITKDNVKNLRPAWTFSTGTLRGHEGAPLVVGSTMYVHTSFPNKVIAGVSGGEFGVRGHVTAYDIKTGQEVWRAYSMGPDEDVRLADDFNAANPHFGRQNQGVATWQGDQWKTGGGTTWGWYAFDPSLNLMYYGTGNPSTWNPTQRPGDNKWSMTIFARDVDTAKAKWAYQMTPWDAWDYDGVNEMILADLTIGGKL